MSRAARRRFWQGALLVPHPPLSAVYLLALRAGWLEPSFLPALVVGLAPLTSLVLSLAALRRTDDRTRDLLFLLFASVEIVWAVLVLAVVGFAVAWRMG